MRAELEPALRGFGPAAPVRVPDPGQLWRYAAGSGSLLAGWSGMGRAASEALLGALTGELRPAALLHVGVAGALRPGLGAGDAVLCEEASCQGEPAVRWSTPEGLRQALGALPVGGALTTPSIVSQPERKRALGATTGADVVEMETYWVARLATACDLPLACVRVVCDRLEDELPDLTAALDPVGRPRPLALVRRLASGPGDTLRLPALADAFGRAQRSLTALARAARGWAAEG